MLRDAVKSLTHLAPSDQSFDSLTRAVAGGQALVLVDTSHEFMDEEPAG